eukprot:6368638-Prymnesium_polylepis.2
MYSLTYGDRPPVGLVHHGMRPCAKARDTEHDGNMKIVQGDAYSNLVLTPLLPACGWRVRPGRLGGKPRKSQIGQTKHDRGS